MAAKSKHRTERRVQLVTATFRSSRFDEKLVREYDEWTLNRPFMKRLLYVSALPSGSPHSGRVLRSAAIVKALRSSYDVCMLTPELRPPPGTSFDVIHVFRLAALLLAKPYVSEAGERHLDLDDIESRTHRRIEALARSNRHTEIADWALLESRRFEMLEAAAFRNFDRVYVCSESDRVQLATRCPAELRVLPNVVSVSEPPMDPPTRAADEPFRFLFIGAMDYYPNFDGYHWFCNEVVPILARMAPENFIVDVAGYGSASRLRAYDSVQLVGEVPDVRRLYERAGAAIVPIRAGGGTRIKILEAFSFGRPVVSTTIGAEGIEAAPDRDILLADSPAAFAAQCAVLISKQDVGRQLASNGLRLVRDSYSESALSALSRRQHGPAVASE